MKDTSWINSFKCRQVCQPKTRQSNLCEDSQQRKGIHTCQEFKQKEVKLSRQEKCNLQLIKGIYTGYFIILPGLFTIEQSILNQLHILVCNQRWHATYDQRWQKAFKVEQNDKIRNKHKILKFLEQNIAKWSPEMSLSFRYICRCAGFPFKVTGEIFLLELEFSCILSIWQKCLQEKKPSTPEGILQVMICSLSITYFRSLHTLVVKMKWGSWQKGVQLLKKPEYQSLGVSSRESIECHFVGKKKSFSRKNNSKRRHRTSIDLSAEEQRRWWRSSRCIFERWCWNNTPKSSWARKRGYTFRWGIKFMDQETDQRRD